MKTADAEVDEPGSGGSAGQRRRLHGDDDAVERGVERRSGGREDAIQAVHVDGEDIDEPPRYSKRGDLEPLLR